MLWDNAMLELLMHLHSRIDDKAKLSRLARLVGRQEFNEVTEVRTRQGAVANARQATLRALIHMFNTW